MAPEGTVQETSSCSDEGNCERGHLCDDKGGDDDDDQFQDSFSTHPEEWSGENSNDQESIKKEKENDSSSPTRRSSILPSFVHTGLERKAPFMEMKYWIALSLTLDGRDKITKVLQYSSRLLAWWFLSKARRSKSFRGHAKRFTSLYKSLGKSRKAFRLGRSVHELQKLSSLGLLGLFCWHLKQQQFEDELKTEGGDENGEDCTSAEKAINGDLTTSKSSDLSSSPYLNRILSLLYTSMGAVFLSDEKSRVQWWKVIGTSLKTIGMFGYWVGDNANFLTSSGALDNYNVPERDRLARRKRWLDITGKKANQFYFFATIIGFFTNSYAYYRFQLKNAIEAKHQEEKVENNKSCTLDTASEVKEREGKQFVLLLALLKSCMDIVVFSNNPGIDLHKKWRGRKNHEAIHCLCGLISAGTSIYNNFPDGKMK